jgi:hypothetical protein
MTTNAPYTPKIGDTVRWGASTQTFTVRTDVFNYHVAATDAADGTMHLFHVDDLVKVEPTPADRYLVFEHNGSRLASGAVSADVDFARTEAPMWQEFRSAWDTLPVQVVSTWIDESGEGETDDLSDLWRRCIAEAKSADVVIAYHQAGEEWKGAFIEIGAALASGAHVYVIGRPPGSWINHPNVTIASDPDDAINDFLAGAAPVDRTGDPQ